MTRLVAWTNLAPIFLALAVAACGSRSGLGELSPVATPGAPHEDGGSVVIGESDGGSLPDDDSGSISAPPPPLDDGGAPSCALPEPGSACAGNVVLTVTSSGPMPVEPPPDGGPEVGLFVVSDAGTTLVIGLGAHPLDGACLGAESQNCGHCSWVSLTVPPGSGPGTYEVEGGGALNGYEGTVTLGAVGAMLAGSFKLSESGGCISCDGTATGSFAIASTCEESVACAVVTGRAPTQCPSIESVTQVPASGGGDGSPVIAVFAALGPQGSGPLDLVTADVQNTALDVYLAQADGGFGAATQIFLDPESRPDLGLSGGISGVAVGDFNGDLTADLVVGSYLGVGVFLGNGDGTLATPTYASLGPMAGTVEQPTVADLNGDGRVDVAVADLATYSVSVLYGNGDGTLGPALAIQFSEADDVEPGTIVSGDFNGDGDLDLAVGSVGHGAQTFFVPGQGSAGFGSPVPLSTMEPNAGANPQTMAAAKLRPGSGAWDLVVANQGEGPEGELGNPGFGLDVFLSNGDGTFQPPVKYTDTCLFDQVGAVAVADVNGDAIPDLVGAFDQRGTYGTALGVWLGKGDGTFAESATVLPVNVQSGFADVTTVATASTPGGTRFLIGQPYQPVLTVEAAANSCF